MSEVRGGHSSRLARIGLIAALVLLPCLVWYVGSFYFLGDLGKFLDDYGAQVRDPINGSFAWSNLLKYQWWFFWRPIHVQLVYVLQTLCWNQDWLNHLFSAAMHLLASVGLWRFLRACGIRPVVACGAGLVMLGSVQGFEAIFWPATVSTSIATAAFMWAGCIAVSHARRLSGPAAVVTLGMLGFVTPCLYEQPAAGLAALPILYFAVAVSFERGRGLERSATRRRSLARTILALWPCGVGVAIYVVLFVASVRHSPMARESRFVGLEELWPRARYTLQVTGWMLDPVGGLDAVWQGGLAVLRRSALGGGVLAAVSVLVGMAWVVGWLRRSEQPRSGEGSQRPSHAGIAAFAVAAILLSQAPIVLIAGASPTPRLTYFPLACLLIVCAAAADGFLICLPELSWRRKTGEAIVAAGAAALALGGCVHLVGVQVAMRARHARDMNEMSQLRSALPTPVSGTIFVPMHVDRDPATPQADRLRNSFLPIWDSPWAVNTYIKHLYARADVNGCAIYTGNQSTAIVRLGEPTMISWSHYVWHLPQPRVENVCPTFATALMVPFSIDAAGKVELIAAVRARTPDGADARFGFAQCVAAVPPATKEQLVALPVDSGRAWLKDWRWTHRDLSEVRFLRVPSWGASERAVRMHPPTPGVSISDGDSDEMTLRLSPSPSPRRFVFFATFDESTIDLSVLGDGVEMRWSLDGESPIDSSSTLRVVQLDPGRSKARKAWESVEVEVPPISQSRVLRLSVGPGKAGNSSYDRVLVTCGEDATQDSTLRNAVATPAAPANHSP